MKKTSLLVFTIVFAAGLLLAGSSFAQDPRANSAARPDVAAAPASVVVTALGPDFSPAPALSQHDIAVYSNKTRANVASFVRAQGADAGLQLAILIDDDDNPSAIGTHFSEIKSFIEAQPPTTQVGIYYAQSGTVRAAVKFSSDHQAVAQKLRLPLGRYFGTSPSVYLSLKSLAKQWPSNNMRHEVLMIASGIDRLHPGLQSPYVDQAIRQVQKDGIVVHTLYTGGFRLAHTLFLQQIAWQNLSRLANDSGGQQFFQGLETPVDFLPIFHKLNIVLDNQYRLTVEMPRTSNSNGKLEPIHLRTEQHNLHLSYASQIFVPGSKSQPHSGD